MSKRKANYVNYTIITMDYLFILSDFLFLYEHIYIDIHTYIPYNRWYKEG